MTPTCPPNRSTLATCNLHPHRPLQETKQWPARRPRPKYGDYKQSLPWDSFPEGTTSTLTFYQVGGSGARSDRGWVLCTLNIGKGRGTARTYGIQLSNEKVCRVGSGPHVLQVVEVRVNKTNKDRLWKYVELHQKGLAAAGQIRDRISTHRAQGQIFRAEGRTSWSW